MHCPGSMEASHFLLPIYYFCTDLASQSIKVFHLSTEVNNQILRFAEEEPGRAGIRNVTLAKYARVESAFFILMLALGRVIIIIVARQACR
jgi:hypothetical protein